MVTTLKARKLTLDNAHQLLGFSPDFDGSFEQHLTLEELSATDRTTLNQIRDRLLHYITLGQVSEGQARELSVAPLLQLSGYHNAPIYLRIEENIDRIIIESDDLQITGRFDIVAVNRDRPNAVFTPLWILVIESKNIEASEYVGIAQMLTYAHNSLAHQSAVWGLVTNGSTYQFFYLSKDKTLTYQYMPSLNIRERDRALQLLQVLRAIRTWVPPTD
jgi:Type I restriction enzyme R protein N terminus (HSDR_N)